MDIQTTSTKVGILFLNFIFSTLILQAQNSGRLISEKSTPKAGVLNNFIYQPPKNLLLPAQIGALILYESKHKTYRKFIKIDQTDNLYKFSFKALDSTPALLICIVDAGTEVLRSSALSVQQKKIVDNNNEAGYILPLYNAKGERFDFEKIVLANLLNGDAKYALNLKTKSNSSLIKMYEDAYTAHPKLKNDISYADYLTVLYEENPNGAKSILSNYANQTKHIQGDEAKWLTATEIYGLLKMDTAKRELENRILTSYPNGVFARQNFWRDFNNKNQITEESVLADMKKYINQFQDSSDVSKDEFFKRIIRLYIGKQDLDNLVKYEEKLHVKFIIPTEYNLAAWYLSGRMVDNEGKNLEFTKNLSKRSIDLLGDLIKNGVDVNQYDQGVSEVLDMYMNTYSLILFKLGQYDSAFSYQDAIYKKGSDLLDEEGLVRYAVYAEKSKGPQYARKFIESQLLKGVHSPMMQKRLQLIYKTLGISDVELDNLREKSLALVMAKTVQTIKMKYGTTKAKDFKLKNLSGEEVSLSPFKNKVIVMDFWATWCTPCRASFPAMQQTVNKYKNDTSVVFIFIDTWENAELSTMQKAAARIMKENHYSFNVLFDTKNQAAGDYKLVGIPAKFIIDKKGDIVFMENDISKAVDISADISSHIEAAKN